MLKSKQLKKTRTMLVVALMILGIVSTALPAQAELFENSGIVLFRGTAIVCGTDIPDGGDPHPACSTSDKGNHGLVFPHMAGGLKRVGSYTFGSGPLDPPLTPLNVMPECTVVGLNGIGQPGDVPPNVALSKIQVKSCDIEATGKLAPVAGIGAACGMSHGHSGLGNLTLDKDVDRVYALSNVGWVASVVGTLPVTGTYQLVNEGGGGSNIAPIGNITGPKPNPKKGERGGNTPSSGPFVGIVQAQGGNACANTNGSPLFNVVGVVKVF